MSFVEAGAPETDPVALLAYYDARNVPDAQLCRIFRCEAAELANVRASAEYKDAVSVHVTEQVNQAASIDDLWNGLEAQSLGGLIDAMPSIADPKMLLGMAVQANKAGRRRGGLAPNNGNAAGRSIIDADGPIAGARVIRLRTTFLEVLQDPDGARRITERQANLEIMQETDLREDLTPGQVKRILREDVGVDPDQISVRQTFGPDAALLLDFSRIAEE